MYLNKDTTKQQQQKDKVYKEYKAIQKLALKEYESIEKLEWKKYLRIY